MIGDDARLLLAGADLGTRVVVRYRLGTGATDALGYLRERTDTTCLIETKRGHDRIRLDEVIAARFVPEPPPPRPRARPVSQ